VNRIPLMKLEDLTPEEQDRYHHAPGGKLNLTLLLAQARGLRGGMGALVQAMMNDITVPPLERQICVLAVLHLDRGAYEWAQHMEVSKAMGIPAEKIAAIADDRFGDPVFNYREKALLAFTRQVVKTVRVDDYVFEAVNAFYTPRQIVELIHVIGIYMLFVRVSEVAELEIDAIAGGDFWRNANAKAGVLQG
jgi:alkylhydroperoxidase family enzyme